MPPRSTLLRPALAASLLLASACASSGAAPAPAEGAPVPVRSQPVTRGALPVPLRVAGTVHPKDERMLSFKVGGLVARIRVEEGERVRRGQVLAELDATELSSGARQAREGLAKAERDRDRARALAAQEVVARAVAEDAETATRIAQAGAEAAEFNLRRSVLTAPDDGWVEERMAEPGEVIAPGRPVLRVSGRGRGFVVRGALADREVLGLRTGQPALVTVDATAGAPISGTISEIARSATRSTGSYDFEVRLDPARSGDLLDGLSAKVEIARQVEVPAAVPLGALVEADGDRGAVFVVEGGRARRVPVRIAFLQGERAVLADDLPGVSDVVTDGASTLADGAPVRLVP
ncbi:MAG TPA: efflux RND transporter periplasmic adaptor subunit [Anaeromyxobacter sp.]|nr:efflux RND transporter periplasmic adaptor subunit [Anaeromyxobacter sp.]